MLKFIQFTQKKFIQLNQISEQNYYVCWSPDDAYIVCVGKSSNSSVISAIDVRNEEVHYKAVVKEDIYEIVFHPNGKFLLLTAENGKLIILE